MATEVTTLTWCDRHLADDGTRASGDAWEVTIKGPGRKSASYVVDACPSCAEVLVAADAFLTTYGRTPGATRRNKRAGDTPAAEGGKVPCPECGTRVGGRPGVMSHMRRLHGVTLADWEAANGPAGLAPPPAPVPAEVACPECGRTLRNVQALGAHRWRSHGIAGTSRAAAGPTRERGRQ